MNTAVKLNETFHEHSSDAALILINLPKPFAGEDGMCYFTFLKFIIFIITISLS